MPALVAGVPACVGVGTASNACSRLVIRAPFSSVDCRARRRWRSVIDANSSRSDIGEELPYSDFHRSDTATGPRLTRAGILFCDHHHRRRFAFTRESDGPTLACFSNLTQYKDLRPWMRNTCVPSLPRKICRQSIYRAWLGTDFNPESWLAIASCGRAASTAIPTQRCGQSLIDSHSQHYQPSSCGNPLTMTLQSDRISPACLLF